MSNLREKINENVPDYHLEVFDFKNKNKEKKEGMLKETSGIFSEVFNLDSGVGENFARIFFDNPKSIFVFLKDKKKKNFSGVFVGRPSNEDKEKFELSLMAIKEKDRFSQATKMMDLFIKEVDKRGFKGIIGYFKTNQENPKMGLDRSVMRLYGFKKTDLDDRTVENRRLDLDLRKYKNEFKKL